MILILPGAVWLQPAGSGFDATSDGPTSTVHPRAHAAYSGTRTIV